jgi:hypothetical protein
MSDRPPEWLTQVIEDRLTESMRRLASAKTADEMFSVQGQVVALLTLKDEIDLKLDEIVSAEREKIERLTTPHA